MSHAEPKRAVATWAFFSGRAGFADDENVDEGAPPRVALPERLLRDAAAAAAARASRLGVALALTRGHLAVPVVRLPSRPRAAEVELSVAVERRDGT